MDPHSRDSITTRHLRVRHCQAQSASDRFGPEALEIIAHRERHFSPPAWPDPDRDDDATLPRQEDLAVPGTERYRNSLTALSSVHNLYFVAYIHRIFVYKPVNGVRSKLDRHPDLQLQVKMSKEARALGGTIDIRKRGQSINHLICGMLGDKEIVVAACDNGDVFAFYTDSMADLIFRTPRPPKQDLMIPDNDKGRGKGKAKTTRGDVPAPPQPFFHSNVGKSAWGLAVHQKSRLIAVSSNLSEVTVFAPSLSGTRGIPGSSVTAGSRRESGQDGDSDNDTRNSKSAEEFVRKRQRNWRIIIGFGQSASNMPNISFLDDKQGNAEKVCAVDIDGSAWIGNIWKSEQPVACIRKSTTLRDFHSDDRLGMPRGWGILALREDHFMEVLSATDMMGGGPFQVMYPRHQQVPYRGYVDITKSLDIVPDNPSPPSERRHNSNFGLHGALFGDAGDGFDIDDSSSTDDNANDGNDDNDSNDDSNDNDGNNNSNNNGDDDDSPDDDGDGNQGPPPAMTTHTTPPPPLPPPPQPASAQLPGGSASLLHHQLPQPSSHAHPPQPPQPGTHAHPLHPAGPGGRGGIMHLYHQHLNHQHFNNHQLHYHSLMTSVATGGRGRGTSTPFPSDGHGLGRGRGMPQPFQPTGFGPGPIIPNHGLPNMQAATPTANPFSSLPVPTIPNGAQLGRGGRGVGILPFHTGHPQPAGAAIANLIAPSQNTTDSEFEQLDAEGTILGSLADTNTPSEGDELLETGQHLAPMQFISQALGPGDPAHSNLLAIARERARRGHLPPIRSGQRLADLENGVGDLVYVPHLDRVDLESNVRQRYRRGRLKCTNVNLSTDNRRDDDGEASATSKMGADDWTDRRYSLLRTYEKDFELFSLPEDADGASDRANDVAVVCFGATRLPSLDNTALTRHFEATSRLSMLAHMPDLYCVVLGSPTGHVMLVSLTRMARPTYHLAQPLAFDRGMRVEYILPRRSEDAAHRPTEPRPLYGVAVGRVPTADDGRHGGHGSENALLPKRYRLMLHYQNHLILTYELTRDEQTQKLLIF